MKWHLSNITSDHSLQPKMRIIDIRDRRLVRFRKTVFCTSCKNGGFLGEIMFVTNIVYVAMITFDILVDISIPNMRQKTDWQTHILLSYLVGSKEILRSSFVLETKSIEHGNEQVPIHYKCCFAFYDHI